MSNTVKTLLQKINFIETDLDLHRQILVSIPSNDNAEMERVVGIIAEKKKEIDELRLKIKETDEDEYNRIITIEQAVDNFKQLSITKKFVLVNTLNETGECYITLNDDSRIECLVAAKEESGNWTILTLDGETREYPSGLIKS